MAAIRSKDTYLRALYERRRSRIGHGRALGAIKHSMVVAAWHILTNGELYHEAGGTTPPSETHSRHPTPHRPT